jgi:hypothetical protein
MSRRLTTDRASTAPMLSLRLPADLEAALTTAHEQLSREHEGLAVSRSDAVRLLLREALRARGVA